MLVLTHNDDGRVFMIVALEEDYAQLLVLNESRRIPFWVPGTCEECDRSTLRSFTVMSSW